MTQRRMDVGFRSSHMQTYLHVKGPATEPSVAIPPGLRNWQRSIFAIGRGTQLASSKVDDHRENGVPRAVDKTEFPRMSGERDR
jgi:hypothetical protein